VRRALSTVVAVALSGSVLAWLLWDLDIARVAAALQQASLPRLALIPPLVALIQGLRAWRFELMAFPTSRRPSRRMVAVSVHLIALNFALPFKLGEVSFPLLMKRAFALPYARSAGILLLARLLDLGAVAAILLAAATLVLPAGAPRWAPPVLLLAAVAAALAPPALAALAPTVQGWAARLRRPLLDHLLAGGASLETGHRRLRALALTLAIWAAHAAVGWLATSAVAPEVPLAAVVLAAAAANLAFALPVPTVAGLGPPQAAWVGAMTFAGVAFEVAVLAALVCHALLLGSIAALWLGVWLWGVWRPESAALGD
jgi:uncharacterized membrane protein YbhN (UPF0104 family)